MALKQEIKGSEARIMIYLDQVHNSKKSLSDIAAKLDIDYGYLTKILAGMLAKKWVFKHPYGRKVFYDNTPGAPVGKAVTVLGQDAYNKIEEMIKQTSLENIKNE
ncbi:MAG: hypothetical protein KAQ85_00730 [Thermodesulfovibrionia bacterium]|nr:hypothetical protein [Thermodesulfovibrionia bacterium]